LNEMLTDGAVAIFGDIFTLLGIVGVLLWLNWRLALVTFVILPVLAVFMSFFRRAMRDSYRQVRTRLARLNAYIAENISGTQIVQLLGREARNFAALDALNLDYLGAHLRSLFSFALFYPTQPVPLGEVRGEVEFRNVWFSYNLDEWVLKDVSFTIKPGESVAIVGATGAGKTSLIALLSRFYDVQRGAILVDGHDVREVAQAALRRHIGVVLQDPFIFSGTIAGNIRLHEDSISDERVRAAARFVNADRFISELPQGYDTPVRERGAGLAVG